MWIRHSCLLLVVVVYGPFWVRIFYLRGVFAILLVSYDLRCVALPPLEIVQCLRDSFRLFLPYRWYHTTSFVPVSSFRFGPPSRLSWCVSQWSSDRLLISVQLVLICSWKIGGGNCQRHGWYSVDERCFALFFDWPIPAIRLYRSVPDIVFFVPIGTGYRLIPIVASDMSATGCNTKGYWALLTAKVPEIVFNTIEMVTIAYKVSISNTTANAVLLNLY